MDQAQKPKEEFETSPTVTKILGALLEAQKEMPPVVRDAENDHFSSDYATIDAEYETAQPVLAKHGILIVQPPISNESRAGAISRLYHVESGEYLGCTVTFESGKMTPQQVGSAITYATRYGLEGLLALRTVAKNKAARRDDDGNAATAAKKAVKPVIKAVPPQAQQAAAILGGEVVQETLERAKQVAQGAEDIQVPFGKFKGKRLSEIPVHALDWLAGVFTKDIEDPEKERWKDKTSKQLSAVEAEIRRRNGITNHA